MLSGLVMEIHELAEAVRGPDQTLYAAHVYGQPRDDGTWDGSLEFSNPLVGTLPADRETTQSNLDQLTHWATGLEPTYLGRWDGPRFTASAAHVTR